MKKSEVAPVYSPAWKKLYTLIQRFFREKPWELFEDGDIFIVQSPRDYQMYLCCVMGNGGEEFGLSAFRGTNGMRNFYSMYYGDENEEKDRNLFYDIDMLSFTLSSRDYLEKHDLNVTKKLMLTFPGGRWPLIRSYRPHYFPWFLSEPEIDDLCDCLEQTLLLYNEGEKALDQIRNVPKGQILIRCKEDSSWVAHVATVGYPKEEITPDITLDDMTIKRLRDLPVSGQKEEIDLINVPGIIDDHEPPYCGMMLVEINEEKLVRQYGLFKPFEPYFRQSCEALVQAMISGGSKPTEVLLKNGSPFATVFEKIASEANIKCQRQDDLPHLSKFIHVLDESMEDDSLS